MPAGQRRSDPVGASTLDPYKAGVADYASVLTAQTARLNAEITAVNLQSQRLVASAGLIDAGAAGGTAAR
jgi:outer membrane protein TolC